MKKAECRHCGSLIEIEDRWCCGSHSDDPISTIEICPECDLLTCCTCEEVFSKDDLTADDCCPKCLSGNWVYGEVLC